MHALLFGSRLQHTNTTAHSQKKQNSATQDMSSGLSEIGNGTCSMIWENEGSAQGTLQGCCTDMRLLVRWQLHYKDSFGRVQGATARRILLHSTS